MKHIYSSDDFKTIIEGLGRSTIESVKITDEQIRIVQTYDIEQIRTIFTNAGYIIRDVYFKDGEIWLDADAPNPLIRPKVDK